MKHLVMLIATVAVAGCVPPPRYVWGNYDEALYRSYKDANNQDAYVEALATATAQGEAEGKVAPGLYAEYGHMLLVLGRKAEAIAAFEAEKRRWPESRVLMDRMIALANGRTPGKPGA